MIINTTKIFPTFVGTTSPFVFNGTGFVAPFCQVSGDDICFFGVNRLGDFICLRIKPEDGSWCMYVSSNYIYARPYDNSINENNASILQISQKSFLITGAHGQQSIFILPDYFKANETIAIKAITFIPQSPCGIGTIGKSFYDYDRQLLATEFYDASPLDSDIFVSIYSPNGSGFSKIAGGYIGNFPNGQDGFNRLSSDLPPYIYTYFGQGGGTLFYSNNKVAFNSLGIIGDPYVGFASSNIVGEQYLSCSAPTSKCFVHSKQNFNFSALPLLYAGAGQSANSGGTGIYDTACTWFLNKGLIFNESGALIVTALVDITAWGVNSKGQYAGIVDIHPTNTKQIYIGQLDPSSANFPPKNNGNLVNSLVNNARPVSINGRFIT